MGYIGKIRAVIDVVDMDELDEAVIEAPEQAAPAAAPESVPA
jgi:hypothetical protein